jgi:hypothetical protein
LGHRGPVDVFNPFPAPELRGVGIELKHLGALVDDDNCDSSRSQVSNV